MTHNRVFRTGKNGINMNGASPPAAFAHNTVSMAGLGGGGFFAVVRGRASAGNFCDDGSCSSEGKRRFYVSPGLHPAASAASVCTGDFHLAQLSEIWDPSGLHYDPNLGLVIPGEAGAPMVNQGWIYGTDDASDCSGYTSSAGAGQIGMLTAVAGGAQWIIVSIPCTAQRRVWCVQD